MTLNSHIVEAGQFSVDGKQYKLVATKHVPYDNAAEFLAMIPPTRRHEGQMAWIRNGSAIELWHFVGGIADIDFVLMIGAPGIESVTGLNTDNSDPLNPVIQIAVDGTTITGDGTPGNPLSADNTVQDLQSVTSIGPFTTNEFGHGTVADHVGFLTTPTLALAWTIGGFLKAVLKSDNIAGTSTYQFPANTAGTLATMDFVSKAGDPTTTDLPLNQSAVFHNVTSGNTYLWANVAGTLKKVQLT